MAHASIIHLQYIINSFSSFAIHLLVNSGGKSLTFGFQTKNICRNWYFIFSNLEKTTELRRGIQPMEVFPMFIYSLLWHCKKTLFCAGIRPDPFEPYRILRTKVPRLRRGHDTFTGYFGPYFKNFLNKTIQNSSKIYVTEDSYQEILQEFF